MSEASPRSPDPNCIAAIFTRPVSENIITFQIDSNQYRGTEIERYPSQRF
ncbi:MAG: hypothetical protein WB443_10180 [Nitrososphaeraceae archaeon]